MKGEFYINKINKFKKIFLPSIFLCVLLFIYILFLFIINPPLVMGIINEDDIKSKAYGRDIIVTLTGEYFVEEFPDLMVVINETVNVALSESIQNIDIAIGEDYFDWRRLFKFDTLIMKTPYDTRNIEINNLSESQYNYEFHSRQSHFLKMLYDKIPKNIFFSAYKFEKKNLEFYPNIGNTINDKIKLHYLFEFSPEESQSIFKEFSEYVWDNHNFSTFFKEDDFIQSKLKINNSTKQLIEIVYQLKENALCEKISVDTVLNKDNTESVLITFDIKYNEQNLKLIVSEHISILDDELSPEEISDIISITNINEITKGGATYGE